MIIGVEMIVGRDGRWHQIMVRCLLEALEGKVQLNHLQKMVPQMEEKGNKRVEVCGEV